MQCVFSAFILFIFLVLGKGKKLDEEDITLKIYFAGNWLKIIDKIEKKNNKKANTLVTHRLYNLSP